MSSVAESTLDVCMTDVKQTVFSRSQFLKQCYPDTPDLAAAKSQYKQSNELVMNIQRISVERNEWHHNLWLFGVDRYGYSVAARVSEFRPKFLFKLPPDWPEDDDSLQELIHQWHEEADENLYHRRGEPPLIYDMTLTHKVRLVGFNNRKPDPLVEVVCASMNTWYKVLKYFRETKGVHIYHSEWSFAEQFKFYHDVNYEQWIKLTPVAAWQDSTNGASASTNIEVVVEADHVRHVPAAELGALPSSAPLLKCTLQTKCVSQLAVTSGDLAKMPRCDSQPHDQMVAIGLTFSWLNPPQQHVTILFTSLPQLVDTNTIAKNNDSNVHPIYLDSEEPILQQALKTIEHMDPDVLIYFCDPTYDSLLAWYQRCQVWKQDFLLDRLSTHASKVYVSSDHTVCHMMGRDFINLSHLIRKKSQLTYDDLYHISSDKDIRLRKEVEKYSQLTSDERTINQCMVDGNYPKILEMVIQDLRLIRLLELDNSFMIELMGIASTNSIDVTTVAEWAMTKFAYGILTSDAQQPESNIYFNVEQLYKSPVRFSIDTHPPTFPDPGEHPKNVGWRKLCRAKLKKIKEQEKKKKFMPDKDDFMWTDANLTEFTRNFGKPDTKLMEQVPEEVEDINNEQDDDEEDEHDDEEDEDEISFPRIFPVKPPNACLDKKGGDVQKPQPEEKEKEGGNVIDDASGYYADDCLFEILDFTSMYPRAQIAYKICYQNLFFPENMAELDRMLKEPKPDDPKIIWIQVSRKETIPVAQMDALLPRIQWKLVLQRKAIKKQMEQAEESGQKFQASVYNSQQLAKKLAGNSLYGYCNAPITYDQNGKPNATCLTLKELMLCTTSMGRRAQRTVAYMLTEKYNCIIVGGDTDSVFPWCPVYRELLPDLPLICQKIREHYQMDEFWSKHWKYFWEKEHGTAMPQPAEFNWEQVSMYWQQKIRTKKKDGDPNFEMSSLPLVNQLYGMAFLVGKKLDQEITGMMDPPSGIEFENAADDFYMNGKKYYCCRVWEPDDIRKPKDKMKIKGMAAVKRNFCPFLKETLKEIPKFWQRHEESKLHQYVRERAMMIAKGKVPLSQLAISGATGDEKRYATDHLVLLQLKHKVEAITGAKMKPGARVNYASIVGTGKKCMRAELLTTIERLNLKVDWMDYLKSQFQKPVRKLLCFHRMYVDFDRIMAEAEEACRCFMRGQKSIGDMLKPMDLS